jgi:hypothetical protein
MQSKQNENNSITINEGEISLVDIISFFHDSYILYALRGDVKKKRLFQLRKSLLGV